MASLAQWVAGARPRTLPAAVAPVVLGTAAAHLIGAADLTLVALAGAWVMLPLGALAVLAAWRYTGGENPYGYRGLGELYVFVFFGLLATLGTLYTQAGELTWFALLGAVGVGAVASAILVANNLRDIPTDAEQGKRTLAVRLGDRRTRLLYATLVAVSIVALVGMAFWEPWVLLGLLAAPLGVRAVRTVLGGAAGRDLVPVLATTGLYEVAYAVLVAVGVIIGVDRA